MGDFLQTLIIAVTLGSLYALIALGYTMVYGILKLINFAHSDVVVLGAWLSFTVATFFLPRLGISLAELEGSRWLVGMLVLVSAMVLCGLIGFTIERLAYKPIRKAPRLNALITAIGVSLLLQNVGQLRYTVVPAEREVAKGRVADLGSKPRTIKLAEPVTIGPGPATYSLRLQPAGTASATVRRVASPPGTYAPGQDIALDQPIGRAMTRDATFSLMRILTPLQLPFGAMPAGMPGLLPTDQVWRHEFTTTIKVKRGADPQETAAKIAAATQSVALPATSPAPTTSPAVPTLPPATQTEAPSVTVEQADAEHDLIIVRKPVMITKIDLIIVGTALALMLGLELLVFHTRLGTAMRAVSYSFETSGLMGIPVDRIVSITFVTGAVLAAAAGFLYAMRYQQIQQPAHQTWVLLGLKAFVAAVIGGIGNIRGAAVGGFLIAFIEQFSGVYFGRWFSWDNAAAFTDVYVFALLIVVLLVKPSGLFGSTVREKV
jgi:branched-subunit amino acid ABC-type transport system permease component